MTAAQRSDSRRPVYRAALSLWLLLPLGALAQNTVTFEQREWALSTNGEDVEWQEAHDYCDTLTLSGHSDWRLPTLDELSALHDESRTGGPEQQAYIREPFPTDNCCLWSSTTTEDQAPESGDFYVGGGLSPAEYAWGYLYSAHPIAYYSAKFFPDGQALCVREGP